MEKQNKKNNRLLISFLLTCSLAVILLVVGVHAASLTTIEPNSQSSFNYTFNAAGSNNTMYFSLPRTANVSSAVMNITGFANLDVYAVDNWYEWAFYASTDSNNIANPRGVDIEGGIVYVYPTTHDIEKYSESNGSWLGSLNTNEGYGVNINGSDVWYVEADDEVRIFGTGVIFNTTAQDNDPQGIVINGSYVYIVGDQNDAVYRYNSTGGYSGWNFSVNAQDNDPKGICFDETNFWVLMESSVVYKYNSSGDYQGVTRTFPGNDGEALGCNSTHIWEADDDEGIIYIKNIVSGTTLDWKLQVNVQDEDSKGADYDGTNYWSVDGANKFISRYTSAGVLDQQTNTVDEETDARGVASNNSKVYIVGSSSGKVWGYTPGGAAPFFNFTVSNEDNDPEGLDIYGDYFYVVGNQTDKVYRYNFTGGYNGWNFSVSTQDDEPVGVFFDGTYFWVLGTQNDKVYKYDSSGIYQNFNFSVTSFVSSPEGIFKDGNDIYVVGNPGGGSANPTGTQYAYKFEGTSISITKVDISNDGDYEFTQSTKLNDTSQTLTDFTSELQDYIDTTCSTALCNVTINVTAGSAGIILLDAVSIQYENKPNITNVTDTPALVNVGSNVTFTSYFTDTDNDQAAIYLCKNETFSLKTCAGGQWCNSDNGTSPLNCNYTVLQTDNTTENYWVFLVDDTSLEALNNLSGSFEVNHRPNASAVNITPATPYTNDTLNCTYTFNDQDSDSENVSLRAFKWYNDTGNLNVDSQTLATGNFSGNENITCSILVYDEHELNDSQYRNSSSVLILNSNPQINSNATIPATLQYYNTTYITANITDLDGDSISYANFTIIAPNGTAIINNVNGTVAGDIWNSSNFLVDQYGTNWTVNITAEDSNGGTVTTEWTFGVNLGTLTSDPASKTYTQQAGAVESVNFNFSHNGTSYNTIDVGLEGDLANTSRFTASFAEDPFNVSIGVNKTVQINITSNYTLPDDSYSGNITLNRTNDGTVFRIAYSVTIDTLCGETSLNPNAKSTTMYSGETETWTLIISNTGDGDLTHCNLSATGTISGFTSFNNADFTITNVTPVSVGVTYTTPSTGTYSGTVPVNCQTTAYGVESTETVTPVSANVQTKSLGGGGGGGGDDIYEKKCNIRLPTKVTISTAKPIEKLILRNDEDVSIVPEYTIKDISGKLSATAALNLDITEGTVPSGDSIDILLKLNPSKLEGNETRYSNLVVSVVGCKDTVTEIEVIIGERKTVVQYLENVTEWLKDYLPFLQTTAFEMDGTEVTWMYVLVLTSVLLMLVFYAFTKNMLHSLGGTAAIVTVIILLIKYTGGI